MLNEWRISKKINAVTTDNATDICSGIKLLHESICFTQRDKVVLTDFYVRCLSHVINIGIKKCSTVVHRKIHYIRAVLNAVRSSVKRRDAYEQERKQFNDTNANLPTLDIDTRWSSTFYMIAAVYKVR